MSDIILGEVEGDICMECKNPMEIQGTFYEGDAVECPHCFALHEIAEVEAFYTIHLNLVERKANEDQTQRKT